MRRQHHYYGANHLHYLTANIYRRARIFDSDRFKLRLEKLTYMHNNPVKRRLVVQPGDWPWSSWRFYHLQDSSLLAMDRMP